MNSTKPDLTIDRCGRLLDAMDDAFCIIEMVWNAADEPIDYIFLYTNRSFYDHTGLADATGKRALELVPGLDKSWLEVYGKVEKTGDTVKLVNEVPQMGRSFEVSAFPLPDNGAVHVGILFRDISRQKQTENLLKGKAKLLAGHNRVLEFIAGNASIDETLVELIKLMETNLPNVYGSILVCDAGPGNRYRMAVAPSLPPEFVDIHTVATYKPPYVGPCSCTVDQDTDVNCPDVPQDERWSPMWKNLVMSAGIERCRSWAIRSFDGKVLGSLCTYSPGRGELNLDEEVLTATTHLAGIAIKRMLDDEAIRENEERFRLLADNMSQLAWVTDESGDVTWYNRTWHEYTGSNPNEVRRDGWTQYLHPDNAAQVIEKVTNYFKSGKGWEDTFQLRSHDNQFRWFLSRANPIHDAQGRVHRWFVTSTDVTEQHEIEQALRNRQERLARINEELAEARDTALSDSAAKDAFLARMSHELRTPLNAMIGYAELLREDLASGIVNTESMCGDLDRIQASGSHLLSLINDILDYSKIVAGGMILSCERVDLSDLLEEATIFVRPQMTARGNNLELSVENRPVVWGDALRIKQVIINLLANAAKFTDQGSVSVKCTQTLQKKKPWVQVAIADSGIGIARDKVTHLFERFSQVDSSFSRRHGGTGLGLAISKSLVEAMGGTIEVSSKLGHGSTFTVRLPAITASCSEEEVRLKIASEQDGTS